jgi:DNA polymerase-3 subunit delta
MATTLSAFRKQLPAGELKSAYLIAGAEHLLVIEAADALRARAKELGYLERDVLDVDAHFDWNRLADAGQSMSLFASRKLVDLRLPTGKPGKEGSAAIAEFCASPPPDTVLLVTANDWSKKHEGAWSSAIERAGVFVPVWPLGRGELPDWIATRAGSRGLAMTAGAIALLADRVEGNLLAAAQEIDKLALRRPHARRARARSQRRRRRAPRRVPPRRRRAWRRREPRAAHRRRPACRRRGTDPDARLDAHATARARARLRGVESHTALRSENIWPKTRTSMFERALKGGGGHAHWENCLAQAGRIDRIAKGRGDGDAWREFERLVAAIAAPRKAAGLLA